MKKDGCPEELVGPPSRDAFVGVVCGDRDVWGKFLCAWCEVKLMVGSAKYASSVGVDKYMDYLTVIGASYGDEGVKLDTDGAL